MKINGIKARAGLGILAALVLAGCAGLFNTTQPTLKVENFWNAGMLTGVQRITTDGVRKDWAQISPDGSQLMYTEVTLGYEGGYYTELSNIVMLPKPGLPQKVILVSNGNAFWPTWYENGVNILYSFREMAGQRYNYRIVRGSSAGGGRTNITRDSLGQWDQKAVIKNGKILLNTLSGDTWRIFSVKDDGSEITPMIKGINPSWHPSGKKFVFAERADQGDGGIHEYDMATGQNTSIYYNKNYSASYPMYSSDGKYIIFQRDASQMVQGEQVTSSFLGGFTSSFSRSITGQEIHSQIFSIRVDGGGETQLTEGTVDCKTPSIDRANTLYFICNSDDVNNNKTEVWRSYVKFD